MEIDRFSNAMSIVSQFMYDDRDENCVDTSQELHMKQVNLGFGPDPYT